MNKEVMCEYCRESVQYNRLEKLSEKKIDGLTFKVIEEYAVCKKCRKEIYVGKIHDRNLERFNDAYAKELNKVNS